MYIFFNWSSENGIELKNNEWLFSFIVAYIYSFDAGKEMLNEFSGVA